MSTIFGVLRFVSPIPNTRTCDRVFGNKFYRTRLMTVVRKDMRAGDRNRKIEDDRNVFTGCSGYNIYYSILYSHGDRKEQVRMSGMYASKYFCIEKYP